MEHYFKQGRPVKIAKHNIKLFIAVYKSFQKRFKRMNQFEIASEIKRAFKEIYAYDYVSARRIDPFESYHDNNLKREPKLVALTKVTREIYNKRYSCGQLCLNAYDMAFSDLDSYFDKASPAAIVQMKKRLMKEWGGE